MSVLFSLSMRLSTFMHRSVSFMTYSFAYRGILYTSPSVQRKCKVTACSHRFFRLIEGRYARDNKMSIKTLWEGLSQNMH